MRLTSQPVQPIPQFGVIPLRLRQEAKAACAEYRAGNDQQDSLAPAKAIIVSHLAEGEGGLEHIARYMDDLVCGKDVLGVTDTEEKCIALMGWIEQKLGAYLRVDRSFAYKAMQVWGNSKLDILPSLVEITLDALKNKPADKA